MKIQVGIITVSDRAAAGEYENLGGPLLREAADGYGWEVLAEGVVREPGPFSRRAHAVWNLPNHRSGGARGSGGAWE